MTTGVEVIRARINPFYLSSDNILAGEVDTYADLPNYANVGDVFLVKTTTGIIGNRKLAGLYVWDGLVWNPVPTAMTATNIYYDNTASGLSANNTQLAIDELKTGSKHIVSASFNAGNGVLTLTLNDASEITTTINFDGLNIGFTTTITNNRIKIGDGSFYIDRGNSNLPLIGFDPNDYIAYNRTDNKLSTVIGGVEIAKTGDGGMGINGARGLSIGGNNTDTPPSTPLAQLYLGGLDNSGFNNSTKLWVDGYDNETPRDVCKFTDENGNNDFNVRSGVNYPILTSRGQTIFSEADRTLYGSGTDLNNMKTAGIYMIGVQATNLPPQRDTNESSFVLVVYTWGAQNGVQTLYCTDRDGSTDFVAMYNRTWEGVSWTGWNCFSSESILLANLNVSIGGSYTNFTVNKDYAYITNTYKQLVYMITTSIHNSTMVLDAPTLALNATYEIGKYSTRYVTIKSPTSTSSTTWQAYGGGVTITNIKLIGYR